MKIPSFVVASALAAWAVGFAMPVQADQNRFMHYFDSNNDGVVTSEEFNQASGDRFTKMDANADGKVTLEEFTKYVRARRDHFRDKRFTAMDTDKNGIISKEEWLAAQQARALRMFSKLDQNADGSISTDEFKDRQHDGHHNGEHNGRHGDKHKRSHGRFSEKVFLHMDTNGDGVVTLDEGQTAWSQWFKRLDTNGDGNVTADEVAKARGY